MKNILLFFLSFFWLIAKGQTPSINITLPPNPPSNTAQWGTGTSILNIIVAGPNMSMLYESQILVTIKSQGVLRCGGYTLSSAPTSNINSPAPKTWIGAAAASLLGQDCTLPPGSYEFCVQFYGSRNGGAHKLLLEKCVPFTIRENTQELCSPPVNINPFNHKLFSESELSVPVTFNWSPIISSYRGLVTYILTVWEVEEGQTNAQAIYNNQPLIQEEVRSLTRYTSRPGIFQKRNAKYVWRIIAVNEEGKPICRTSQSEHTDFSTKRKESASGCLDFEGEFNAADWPGFHVSGISIANDIPHGNYLKLKDGAGGSIVVNYKEFGGNWLQKGKNGCLCFDYMVDWNTGAGINTLPVKAPKIGIYSGAPIANVPPNTTSLPSGSNVWAGFIGNPSNPDIQDNVWKNFCLPVGLCVGGQLPSNLYGQWAIYNASGPLTGAAACLAWNTLIQNVTGFYLATDYNSQPSEIVNFDNFCWDCEKLPPSTECCDIKSPEGCLITDKSKVKVECIGIDSAGKSIYKISGLIVKNTSTKPAKTGLTANTAGTNYIVPNPSNSFTVVNLTPASSNPIPAGQEVNISFIAQGVTGNQLSFFVDGSILSNNGICDKRMPILLDSLPGCNACDYCNDQTKSKIITEAKTVVLTPSSTITIAQQFNITPINITRVTAELISFSESTVDTTCIKCPPVNVSAWDFIHLNTAKWNSGANLTGSPNNNSVSFPSNKIIWFSNSNGTLKLNMTIALPEAIPGAVCNRKGKFCIRYSFTDINCKTCERVICYDF